MNKKLTIAGIIGFVILVVVFALSVDNKRKEEIKMNETVFSRNFVNYLIKTHPNLWVNEIYDNMAEDSLIIDYHNFIKNEQDTLSVKVGGMTENGDSTLVDLDRFDVFSMDGRAYVFHNIIKVLLPKEEAIKLVENKSYTIKIDEVGESYISLAYSNKMRVHNYDIDGLDVELCNYHKVTFL